MKKYEQTTGIVKKQDQPYFKKDRGCHKETRVVELISETEQTSRHRDKTCLPREKGDGGVLG